MREITPEGEVRGAETFSDFGVLDALVEACRAEPSICAVHERLKAAYIKQVAAIKETIANGSLQCIQVSELEKLGNWVFRHRELKDKEKLNYAQDVLGNILNTALTYTQVNRVLEEATKGHQGPDTRTSMSLEEALKAWQMYEDGAKWQDVANKFEAASSGDPVDRLSKRLRPLRSVVKKHCPLPKNRKQIHL